MLLQDNGSLSEDEEEEEAVNFTCSFSRNGNIGLDIQWTVDGERVCEMENFKCFDTSVAGSDTKQSVLAIQNTGSLTSGDHQVVCTAQFTLDVLPMTFRNDQSYNASDLAVRKSATLTVSPIVITPGILIV